MIIRFADIGSSFGTRSLGNRIREDVLVSLNSNIETRIVFDFEDVEVISNSFADECFGKLIDKIGLEKTRNRTTFRNANDIVTMVIKKAISDRLRYAK